MSTRVASSLLVDVLGDVDAQLDASFDSYVRPLLPTAQEAVQVLLIIKHSLAGDVDVLRGQNAQHKKVVDTRVFVKLLDGSRLIVPVHLIKRASSA
jgi:hypothetical protein